MLLGAHLSIVGGLYRALERAAGYGFGTLALFVRNQRQWHAPPLGPEAVAAFRAARRRLGIGPVLAHGSYLVNLAGSAAVRSRSLAATADELERCARLGLDGLVIHPGTCPDEGEGIRLIAEGLNELTARRTAGRVRILLETTAGQGSCLGRSFEQLADILARLDRPQRFGVCLDTCHVFAAGYDVRTPEAYARTMEHFDRVVGLRRLRAVHVNDSLKGLGLRVDRHQHIGRGAIGLAGLANFLCDERLRRLPFLLETPKGTDADTGRDWDEINAEALRGLASRPA